MIPELFNYIQVLILDLLSVFGFWYLNPFLVVQLSTDVVTINRPDMVENIIPSRPNFIYSPFLAIVEYMVYQGTAQPFVIII